MRGRDGSRETERGEGPPGSSRLRRAGVRVAAAALGLAAVGAFFVLRIVQIPDAKPLRSDLLTYFYPIYRATAAQLARGAVPLWNPYQLCGIPWLATLQAGVLYPPHLLHLRSARRHRAPAPLLRRRSFLADRASASPSRGSSEPRTG